MILQKPIHDDFEFEQIYHLFTRVSGNELIFRKEGSYLYFLDQISKYLLPIMDIYAYCLVPQRFSLLICFRSQAEICLNLHIEMKDLSKNEKHKFLMQPISNLLNSYAKAYNKMFQRKGALFVDFIKREKFDHEEGLKEVYKNIHQIPVHSQAVNDISEWKYSSYKSYLDVSKPSKINRNFMLGFFENQNDFIEFHKK